MTAKQVVLYTALVVAVVMSIYMLYLIRDVLILIFIAILLATAIAPLVERLRLRIGRGWAVLVIYVGIAVVLGVIGYLVTVALIEQGTTLATNLPAIVSSLQGFAGNIQVPFLRQMLLDLLNEVAGALSIGEANGPSGVAKGVFTFTVSLINLGFGFFTVFVIAYYWITQRVAILRLFLSLFPPDGRSIAGDIWHDIELRLGGWVRGQLLLMGIIAALFALGFSVLGLRYSLLLAVFAGLVEIIPIFGPWIGAAPAVLVALTQDVWLAVVVALYAALVQLIEGNVLVPRILGGTVGINPLLVIIALLVGVALKGVVGALVAVPVVSAVQAIVGALLLARRRSHAPPLSPDVSP